MEPSIYSESSTSATMAAASSAERPRARRSSRSLPTLQLLDHPVIGDRDDGRRAGRQAVADLLQILILETLVANLAPHAARTTTHGGGDDDAGGKIRPTTPPAIAPRFAHFLPLGSAVSFDLDLAVCGVDDHGGVDQVDRAVPLGRLKNPWQPQQPHPRCHTSRRKSPMCWYSFASPLSWVSRQPIRMRIRTRSARPRSGLRTLRRAHGTRRRCRRKY